MPILLTNFPFPPSLFPYSSLSLFICPDIILCHSCELSWFILTLLLEQCQSWQQGNQQRYLMKRSERKNGWRSWISLLPKMPPNQEPEGRAGHKGSKNQSYSECSKLCCACVCRGCCSLRCSHRVTIFPAWLYTSSSQPESKELPVVHFHVLGTSGMSPSIFQSLLHWVFKQPQEERVVCDCGKNIWFVHLNP